MPLSVGEKLGPYEILALIGKGGMGEVYRAHDSRLNRDVAIKVSNAQFTERFTREARAIAALNHTNICHLYDVGPNYLVMEYVEGPDLRGPLDFGDALPIIQQLIDGIEAAHEKNIVHRDLKPANIKITPEGVVKILDFGLAKAMEPPPSEEGDPANSPALTIGATAAGAILGTAAYMAPEQAKGKAADKRSDIWSFGVVLYEMLTGQRLFQGESAVEILGGVLNKEPDLSAAPQRVHKLLRWCLEKDRKQRLASISDVRRLLNRDREGAEPATLTARSHSRLGWVAWGVAGLLLATTLGVSIVHFREQPSPAPEPARFQIPVPDKATLAGFPNPTISPDGRRVVFQAITEGGTRLWVRALGQLEPRPLAGTEGVTGLQFWSPDSRFIAFGLQGTLKKVEASGGPPQSLCSLPGTLLGGLWTGDGRIVFATLTTGLFQVAAAGGAASPATVLDPKRQEAYHAYPALLPDSRHFLYMRNTGSAETRGVYLGTLGGGTAHPGPEQQAPKRLLADASSAVFAPSPDPRVPGDGYVLFSREGTLMAQPFDGQRLAFSGDALPIAEQVQGNGDFSVSSTGVLVYAPRVVRRGFQLTWYDRRGRSLGTAGAAGLVDELELAPDGTRVAVVRSSPNSQPATWVDEFARGVSNRITPPNTSVRPVWSPDGNRLVFESPPNISLKAASNAGKEEVLFKFERPTDPLDWSRDGRWLLYQEVDPKTKRDLWALPMEPGKPVGKPVPFLQTASDEREGKFSPDGAFVAYVSDESGTYEVYVASFPAPSLRVPISNGGGYQPRWRRDGKELLYFTGEGKLMSVDVTLSGTFKASVPKVLFQAPIFGGGNSPQHRWDMTADGQRFLINIVGGDVSAPLTLVQNWTALLRK